MKRYIPLFESKLVDGEFGKFGFLIKQGIIQIKGSMI